MKRIGFIFIIVVFCVQSVFAQLTESQTEPSTTPTQEETPVENDNENTEPVSPETPEQSSPTPEEGIIEQDSENTSPSIPDDASEDSNKETNITPTEGIETEKPPDTLGSTQPKWKGSRRIIKLVNDYELKTDEALTTLIMIAGDATIYGTVTGNVVVFGGNVNLMPEGKVNGMLQVIGGQVTGNLEAVSHYSVNNRWKIVPAAAQLLMHPHSIWDIRKHRNFRLTTLKFGLLLLTYLLFALAFPKPVTAISSQLTSKPIQSLLFCILMFVVVPIVSWVLILSIVGFPSFLLGICLLVPMAICGKVAIFYTLGSTLLAGRLKPLAVIFGFIPYFMATEIPHIDWIAFLAFNGIGISLCILSGLNAMSSQNQNKNVQWSERGR